MLNQHYDWLDKKPLAQMYVCMAQIEGYILEIALSRI